MDVPANQAPPRVNTVESALRLCLRALEGFTADCLSAIHQVDVATMDRGGSVQTMIAIGGLRSTAAVDKRPWREQSIDISTMYDLGVFYVHAMCMYDRNYIL